MHVLHVGLCLHRGRYELLAPIGQGGTGVVWRALDRRERRTCAIKLLPMPEGVAGARPEIAREAARREVAVARRVSHPNLLRVDLAFEDGGWAGVVMEPCARNLADRVEDEGPLAPGEALRVMGEACAAVGAAHTVGIVHRDLKPQNLLLREDGSVAVADWGLAHAEQTAASARTTGTTLLGTLPYLAPELRLDTTEVSPASDVYALGITLAWVCTGRAVAEPYVEEARSALARRLPPAVLAVVTRACAYAQGERYADATGMGAALREAATELDRCAAAGGMSRDDRAPADAAGGDSGRAPSDDGSTGSRVGGGVAEGTPSPLALEGPKDGREGGGPPSAPGARNTLPRGSAAIGVMVVAGAVAGMAAGRTWPSLTGDSVPTPSLESCPNAFARFADRTFAGPVEAVDAGAEDLDGDGLLDAVFVNQGDGSVTVRKGTRDGTFPEIGRWTTDRSQSAPAFGDYDGDGVREVILAQPDLGRFRHATLLPGPEGTLAPGDWDDLFQSLFPHRPVTADWNRDGVDDLVFGGSECTAWREGRRGKGLGEHRCIETPDVRWQGEALRVARTSWPLVSTARGLEALVPGPGGREGRRHLLVEAASPWVPSGGRAFAADPDRDGTDSLHAITARGELVRWEVRAEGDAPALGTPCRLAEGLVNDVLDPPERLVDVDGDGTVDALRVRSCAGCTSNHVVGVGVR